MLTDDEIRAIQAQHPTENDPMPFARALLAYEAKLTQGVEPVAVAEGADLFWIAGVTPDDEVSQYLYPATALAAAKLEGAREMREAVARLVLYDAYALTFQTFGKYRTALAKELRTLPLGGGV